VANRNALPFVVPAEQCGASSDLSESFDNSTKHDIEENPFHLRDDHLNDTSRTSKSSQNLETDYQMGSSILRTDAVIGFVPQYFPDHSTLIETRERGSNSVQRNESTLQPSLPRASFSTQISFSSCSSAAFAFAAPQPSSSELLSTIEAYGLPRRVYRDPYYSRRADAPEHAREYAGLLYHLKGGDGLETLEEWKSHESQLYVGRDEHLSRDAYMSWGWEYAALPPSKVQVNRWLKENPVQLITKAEMHSQVSGKLNILCLSVIPGKCHSDRGRDSNESLWREINATSSH